MSYQPNEQQIPQQPPAPNPYQAQSAHAIAPPPQPIAPPAGYYQQPPPANYYGAPPAPNSYQYNQYPPQNGYPSQYPPNQNGYVNGQPVIIDSDKEKKKHKKDKKKKKEKEKEKEEQCCLFGCLAVLCCLCLSAK